MKKSAFLLILILLAGGGFYFWKKKTKMKQARAESVSVVEVRSGVMEDVVEATGEVTPLNRVEIKPPISGRIEELLVDEGSLVKRGQILAWLSSSDRAAILDAARAQGADEVKRWEDSYKPTPIIAPLSGVIILRNVVVGQTVEASTILFAMSDRLIVLAQVDESDIGRLRVNLPVRITLDAYPEQPVKGHVSQILYEGKNVSNVITYGVKVTPKDIPPFFRSQMTANVSFLINRKENVLVVPAAAVRDDANVKTVSIPVEGEKPENRAVETGLESGEMVEILSGLKEGDKILVSKRKYVAQKGPQSSPLMMGGSNRQNNRQQGQSR